MNGFLTDIKEHSALLKTINFEANQSHDTCSVLLLDSASAIEYKHKPYTGWAMTDTTCTVSRGVHSITVPNKTVLYLSESYLSQCPDVIHCVKYHVTAIKLVFPEKNLTPAAYVLDLADRSVDELQAAIQLKKKREEEHKNETVQLTDSFMKQFRPPGGPEL